jgi:hypothetical protein
MPVSDKRKCVQNSSMKLVLAESEGYNASTESKLNSIEMKGCLVGYRQLGKKKGKAVSVIGWEGP